MKVVHVSAPSRIHFGLLSLDHDEELQFGGAGVMVDRPRVEIQLTTATTTQVRGPHAGRVQEFIESWRQTTGIVDAVACTVLAAPEEHVGLGLGTQLGLAVASALNELHGRPPVSAAELALSVQRGRRSAVGSYGFHEGGLIVERGKRAGAALSDSWERIALPESWKLLLIRPLDEIGLAGQDEMRAFQRLPSVSQAHDRRLRDTLFNLLVPAARAGNFRDFSEGVFQYGKLAGECFAPCQHGAFRSATITRIVQWNRTAGARGVGQSSWGPTIFCWCETTQEAELVAHDFRAEFSNLRAEILVAAVDPGAKVTIN